MTVKLVTVTKDFSGSSTDSKPTSGVTVGSAFIETDTRQEHIYTSTGGWVTKYGEEFDRTIYPVRAQGTASTGGVQYSGVVTTTTSGENIDLWTFDTSDYFSRLTGTLAWVNYEINFQLKAANDSADLTWQLQARDKGGDDWVDMCAEQSITDVGTSGVARTIQGYLDIQTNIELMPFEMRLRFNSNEGSAKSVDTWTQTAAYANSTTWKCFAKFSGQPIRVYGGVAIPLHDCKTVAWYNEATNVWTACGQAGGSNAECRCMLEWDGRLYIGTNVTINSTTDVNWSQVYNDPKNIYCLAEHTHNETSRMYAGLGDGKVWWGDGPGENDWHETTTQPSGASCCYALIDFNDKLYVGTYPDGNVFYTDDAGASWKASGELAGANYVYCFAEFNNKLYAGTTGKVFVSTGDDVWAEAATLTNSTKVSSLAVIEERLYAGSSGEIFHSVDGTNWVESGGLSGATVINAIVQPETTGYPYRVYAGANGDKAWYGELVSGEATGKVRNDTVIRVVGEVG